MHCHLCACVWGLEVDIEYLPLSLSTLIFEAGFHSLNLEITSLARLAGHGALGILLFKLTQCWDCKVMIVHRDISHGC